MDAWLGRSTKSSERASMQQALASRQAPNPSIEFMAMAQQCTTRWTSYHDEAMAQLWMIWTTITPVMLWRLRNRHVLKDLPTTNPTSPKVTGARIAYPLDEDGQWNLYAAQNMKLTNTWDYRSSVES
ncbi:hypothetical protein L915_21086, partial [Phytophthora nicotianae]